MNQGLKDAGFKLYSVQVEVVVQATSEQHAIGQVNNMVKSLAGFGAIVDYYPADEADELVEEPEPLKT